MTPLKLIEHLAENLRDASAHFKFPAQYEGLNHVQTFVQTVPADKIEASYPLICVELLATTDGADISTALVLLSIGTYAETSNAWQDNLNLAEQVREWILRNKLVGAAALDLPVEFATVEKDDSDFIFSQFLLTYRIPTPEASYF